MFVAMNEKPFQQPTLPIVTITVTTNPEYPTSINYFSWPELKNTMILK